MKKYQFHIRRLLAIAYLLSPIHTFGQPQEAWITRYNGGFSNKTHTPLAMALDNAGNIYVAGSSQNASNDYDYIVLKYAPNGTQLFAARYDSTNGANDIDNGFALDKSGSSYVTGSGGTVKFNANGAVGWTAGYAGNDVAVDTNGNTYVTGFSTNDFATVKLDSNGTNIWTRMYDKVGKRDESQKVAVDGLGNVYVAGWESWSLPWNYSQAAMLKYDAAGNSVWTNEPNGGVSWGETKGLIPDDLGNVYVTRNGDSAYSTAKINVDGQRTWGFGYGPPGVKAMSLNTNGNVYLTGSVFDGPPHFVYGTFKLDNSGGVAWQRTYSGPISDQANALSLDNSGNVFITGVSTNTATGNDFATLKYDNDGNQQWVKRYNGPANGNDGATAIAVSPDGSIYVTGYSANSSGGVDITTIKYGSLDSVQKKSNGDMLLQFFGTPGQNYGLQGTTNFQSWDELGSSIADTNGLFEFLDTNAPLFPHRFYRYYLP